MNDRDRILKTVRTNRPASVPDPERKHFGGKTGSGLSKRFAAEAERAGSIVRFIDHRREVTDLLHGRTDSAIWSNIPGLEIPGVTSTPESPPDHPDKLDLVLMEGELGAAENAAIWIAVDHPDYRIIPFITRHLILLLPVKRLVETMHDAYRQLQGREYGFGTFIAGPSKTADIEQRLVLGAHGPLTLTICLTSEE